MVIGFDADMDVTPVLPFAKAKGVGFVARYISKASGGLTQFEALAIAGAEIKNVSIWETTAKRALLGLYAGIDDGRAARLAAQKIGQQSGAVYFTVDFDDEVDGSQQPMILDYLKGCRIGIAASIVQPVIKTGVYANGAICQAALDAEIADYTWLAGGMGMRGSEAFANSGKATIIQDVGDKRGLGLGIDIDTDVAHTDDFGGWVPGAAVQPIIPRPAPLTLSAASVKQMIEQLQHTAGATVDGEMGPETEAKVKAWQKANPLS